MYQHSSNHLTAFSEILESILCSPFLRIDDSICQKSNQLTKYVIQKLFEYVNIFIFMFSVKFYRLKINLVNTLHNKFIGASNELPFHTTYMSTGR